MFSGDEVEEAAEQKTFILEQDVLKALVGVLDVVGFYILFSSKKMINILGDIDIKILSIGLGWAAAELVTTNFIDIIF